MIGNFICSAHGYFEPWFFSVSRRANAGAGTEVRCHGGPTPHPCPQTTQPHWQHNTDDKDYDTKKENYHCSRDGPSDWLSEDQPAWTVDVSFGAGFPDDQDFKVHKVQDLNRLKRRAFNCSKINPLEMLKSRWFLFRLSRRQSEKEEDNVMFDLRVRFCSCC